MGYALHWELIEVSYLKLLLSRSLFWIPNIWLDVFVHWFFILIRALRCLNQLYLAFHGVDLIFWLSSQGDLEAQDPSFIGCATIFFKNWVRLVRSKGSHHNRFQIDNHAFKFKFHYYPRSFFQALLFFSYWTAAHICDLTSYIFLVMYKIINYSVLLNMSLQKKKKKGMGL